MGLIVDTNVLIAFERRGEPVDVSAWEPTEDVFVSVITVSELLTGVHRADTETRRARRSAFVEAIISGITALDFTTEIARIHARLWADLAARGLPIGAHDLIIAATAVAYDLSLLTENSDEFSRIHGLNVVNFS